MLPYKAENRVAMAVGSWSVKTSKAVTFGSGKLYCLVFKMF